MKMVLSKSVNPAAKSANGVQISEQVVLAGGWMEVADIAAEAISAGLHSDGKELKDNKPMRTARSTLRIETKRMGSQLATFIASTVSTGGDWPGDEGRAPLGNVVIAAWPA